MFFVGHCLWLLVFFHFLFCFSSSSTFIYSSSSASELTSAPSSSLHAVGQSQAEQRQREARGGSPTILTARSTPGSEEDAPSVCLKQWWESLTPLPLNSYQGLVSRWLAQWLTRRAVLPSICTCSQVQMSPVAIYELHSMSLSFLLQWLHKLYTLVLRWLPLNSFTPNLPRIVCFFGYCLYLFVFVSTTSYSMTVSFSSRFSRIHGFLS